jgi:hypothetical protein
MKTKHKYVSECCGADLGIDYNTLKESGIGVINCSKCKKITNSKTITYSKNNKKKEIK